MRIKNRLALQFSLIVASILIIFSGVIYLNSARHRQEDFFDRLKQKARTTVKFLVEVKEVDKTLLKIIDRNTLTALYEEKVLIFNEKDELVYSSVDDQVIHYRPHLLWQTRQQQEIEVTDGENEVVGILYQEAGHQLVVLASAHDRFGKRKLDNLRTTLLWGLIGGLTLTAIGGIFFAGQALGPISRINEQIKSITARNLRQRLDEGTRQDEIDQLAVNFNEVLQRLEQAFEQQRSFVSHASHELRTPLAALKSEIQLGLRRPVSAQEHEAILKNLLSDADRLIGLTNSLLFLAKILEQVSQFPVANFRMEDVLFTAREELLSAHPHYTISISYANQPQTETDTLLEGNEELLKRIFLNLLDNACKYSPTRSAQVQIATNEQECRVAVIDQGIGIPAEDLTKIFTPFWRASNALAFEGFGIGLSICQRLAELHRGRITVSSDLGQGSTFTLILPHQ